MTRKACTLLLAALLVSACVATATARTMRQSKHDFHKNESGEVKTDFHVTLSSDTPFLGPTGTLSNNNVNHRDPTITPSNEGKTIEVVWDGLNIPDDDTFSWRIFFRQDEKNHVDVSDVHLTPVSSQRPPPLPVLGLRVLETGEYSLTNTNTDSVWYSELQFAVLPDSIPLTGDEMLERMYLSESGNPFQEFSSDWVSLPGGSIPPLAETFLAALDIQYGDYLYCFLRSDYEQAGGLVSYDFQMHEHAFGGSTPVEESTWGRIKDAFLKTSN